MAKPVFILNGPNLNLLGQREPDIYGKATLGDIEAACEQAAQGRGLSIAFRQSNAESDLVSWIQEAAREGSGIIINAAAYTHTSVALRDALLSADVPSIEIHLSNVHKREDFRKVSYISAAVVGIIAGFGPDSYTTAVHAMANLLEANTTSS